MQEIPFEMPPSFTCPITVPFHLRLDELLADAHTSLAHAKLHAIDWKGSEKEFRRAIQLGPVYPVTHFYYANFLTAQGRFEEAIAEAQEAVRLDPVSMVAEAISRFFITTLADTMKPWQHARRQFKWSLAWRVHTMIWDVS